ncbi:MAG: formyl transferase [Polaribacter sp.]
MEKILIVGTNGKSTRILYNKLKEKYDVSVIIEDKISKKQFYKYRLKKIGLIKVIGQIVFSIYTKFYLEKKSFLKVKTLYNLYNLNDQIIPVNRVSYVKSINSDLAREFIENNSSIYIIVSGTRIIGKKILSIKNKKFINIHAGITPRYRGVHGAYWALVNKDYSNIGVTLHYVDPGVDTGKIIAQSRIVTTGNNFITYTVIQLGEGVELLIKFLENTFNGKNFTFSNYSNNLDSRQYFHPTIWFYFYNLWFKGIK